MDRHTRDKSHINKVLTNFFIFLVLPLVLLTGCSSDKKEVKITSVDDLDGKKVGVFSGTFHDQLINKYLPNTDVLYFNTSSELITALFDNKIDCYSTDVAKATIDKAENDGIDFFEVPDTEVESGFIFSDSSSSILSDFNEFISSSKKSGFLDEMEKKWILQYSINEKIENKEYNKSKGNIKIICENNSNPYSFLSNGELEGYSIEIVKEFAYQYGYGLNIDYGNFDAILSGVTSGKYDIGVGEISITEERKKSMIFSDPIHVSKIVIMHKTDNVGKLEYHAKEELNGKTFGCMNGSIYDRTIESEFKDAEIVYFNSRAELLLGLKQGKIEAYLADEPVAIIQAVENNDIGYFDAKSDNIEYGICFSSDSKNIKNEFNKFLKEASNNGTLDLLQKKWFSEDGINQHVQEVKLTGEKGTIRACTTPDAAPFSFYKNNKYEGYEVDLVTEFAKRYGYELQIEGTSFDALLSSITSNKFDLAFNGIYITDERKNSVDFSDSVYASHPVVVVRKGVEKNTNIINKIKEKIYKTFIEEERYKLILDGIGVTLLITGLSLIFGTLLGFVIYLLSLKLGTVFKKIADVTAYIISGLPVVVLLMILFYIIFSKSSLSGTAISIVGFTLIEGFSVYGMLKTGVGAIDIGQFEGAYALGYTENQTLFKFIFPQAFRIIMPSYRGEIVSLIKSSSVVGYVTVQDLTRVSDIIRSRTYDAFFPLIVTAIIYFVLAWILTKVADILQKKFLSNKKTKEEILKSVGQKPIIK